MFDFIFQGVTKRNHADAIRKLLEIADFDRGLISVAFLNSSGVALIENALRPNRKYVTAFVGIRNDITSAQGLKRLLPVVSTLYVVDTGARSPIFHPKIYLTRSEKNAHLIVGSANLTMGGLWNNIETSAKLTLDLSVAASNAAVEKLERLLDGLAGKHPNNVIQIRTVAEIDALLEAGRVVDECVTQAPHPSRRGRKPENDPTPRMELARYKKPPILRPNSDPALGVAKPARPGVVVSARPRRGFEHIWKSKPLKERALNIPSGKTSAPAGSMLFTKGRTEDIDQRHFFRDNVFNSASWTPDPNPNKKHLERATASFKLIIKNVDYGSFVLDLTHDSRRDSGAYKQKNSVTQIHWGEVAPYVRRRDLLGRTLNLYRNWSKLDHFILEID